MTTALLPAASALKRRSHPAWVAFLVHRLSGLLLALFLPMHFWALGQAIEGEARLDAFLRWTDNPLTKFAEFGLVVLLAAHLGGGLRLLSIEFLGWRDWQSRAIAFGFALGLAFGLLFLLNLGA
jgi:fumarate reductase subunit D